jgi:hypothetical protein
MAISRPALSLTLGALLLVGPPVAWNLTRPPAEVGDVTAAQGDRDETEAADAPRVRTPDAAPRRDPTPRDGGSDDAPEEDEAPGVDEATPVRVRIPAIGTDAGVDPVGLEPSGGMELPDDVSRVGWYEPGPAPGAAGSAVLAGHVDSRTQGAGALFRLRELDVDDEIELTTEDGDQRWRVVARASYPKQALPIEELFTWDGPARLVVITCGGEFDAETGSYEENVVVHAVRA